MQLYVILSALTAIPLSSILLTTSSPEQDSLRDKQHPRWSGSLGDTTFTVAIEI